MTIATRPLQPGDVIQDTYEVERLLGCGGMGCTYKGLNRANGHPVAIKVIGADLAASPRALQLFKRESNLLRSVRNDAVVRYETTIQDSRGTLYLILEYVEGRSLAHYLARGARLPSRGVLELGQRLAGGLAAIHALNIVHRDVAPDNIVVPDDDVAQAKLIDFGLASDTIGTEKSIVGDSFAGKVSYCAPEQLGLFGGQVTSATDVYALGLVLMRVAGLRVPGEGAGFGGALEARRADVAIPNGEISAPLARTLQAMLRADPAARPTDLPALLREALAAPEIPNGADRAPPGAEPPPNRRPALVAAAVAGLLLAGGAAYLAYQPDVEQPEVSSQLTIAQRALAETDPLAAGLTLAASADPVERDAALAVLMHLGGDAARPAETRQRALLAVAEMYDPATFDPARSPAPQADAASAARFYQRAADLGSSDARNALARLGD